MTRNRIRWHFSGGKDSALLLYALVVLARYGVVEGELAAITIDPGMEPLDPGPLVEFCRLLGVEHHLVKTEIGRAVAGFDDPCARCSYLRRGIICRFAREHGFNKVALGHHHDDAVETFLMSILYSADHLFAQDPPGLTEATVIRPWCIWKAEVKKAVSLCLYPAKPVCSFARPHWQKS